MRTLRVYLDGANRVERRNVSGRFLKVLEATGIVEISIDNGPWHQAYQGLGVSEQQFQHVAFRSSLRQFIEVAWSDVPMFGEYRPRGIEDASDDGAAFSITRQIAPVASQYSCLVLKNPVSSSKKLLVDRTVNYAGGTGSAGRVLVGVSSDSMSTATLTLGTVQKKKGATSIYSPASVAEMYHGAQAAGANRVYETLSGAGESSVIYSFTMNYEPINVRHDSPIVLYPGFALAMVSTAQFGQLWGDMYFREARL